MQADPITDADLTAYVDGQLELARRVEVEAYLSTHAGEAMQVMADLRLRNELRAALLAAPLPISVRTGEAASRLERSLKRRVVVRRVARAAVLVLLLGAGWFAHDEFNALSVRSSVAAAPPPAFVADAIRSHRTSEIRADMSSQVESAAYDPAEILSATAIRIPALPKDWKVRDVQVFPSTFGPSLEVSIAAPDAADLSLFAVRPGSFDVLRAATASDGDTTAAYWQVGEVAYALVGRNVAASTLRQDAVRIEESLH
ncbi:anti-sigma factor family protein [Mangrovicella endophytica]|uniref:anti-sigma factor family protein n=1 Tax=Mangrovicella endophytica TaxID=2066697 RepID=UPI000C9E50F1|nr:Fis family transcriptional regulator [Mangrovicella endophytica]